MEKQTSFAPHTWFSGMPQAPLVTQHCHSGTRRAGFPVPCTALAELSINTSSSIRSKRTNGINHPAGHAARLPSPVRGSCGSRALRCLYQECFLVGSLCLVEGGLRHTWKTKGSLCFSHGHMWKPKTSPRIPCRWWGRHCWRTIWDTSCWDSNTSQWPLLHLPTSQISHASLVFRYLIG